MTQATQIKDMMIDTVDVHKKLCVGGIPNTPEGMSRIVAPGLSIGDYLRVLTNNGTVVIINGRYRFGWEKGYITYAKLTIHDVEVGDTFIIPVGGRLVFTTVGRVSRETPSFTYGNIEAGVGGKVEGLDAIVNSPGILTKDINGRGFVFY